VLELCVHDLAEQCPNGGMHNWVEFENQISSGRLCTGCEVVEWHNGTVRRSGS